MCISYDECTTLVQDVDSGGGHVCSLGSGHMGTLYSLFNFVVSLKWLFRKLLIFIKKKIIALALVEVDGGLEQDGNS